MFDYLYDVPEPKRIRYIIHTDAKNEADDQFAIAHDLMTPLLDIKGIIAGHFDNGNRGRYPGKGTMQASYDEILKVMDLMHLSGQYPVLKGAAEEMPDEKTPIDTEGARFIIEEAMKDDDRPLFIGCQGAITDLASAILMEPRICDRMTCIWVGGGIYPEGGSEFNLEMDIAAANVLFSSSMPMWQCPKDVYKQMAVSLAELQRNVEPYGQIGHYLFTQMADFNREHPVGMWPHGEIWGLGDQAAIATLLEEVEKIDIYDEIEAPRVDPATTLYVPNPGARKIRVYHTLNARLVLSDFFCKLQINYPERNS